MEEIILMENQYINSIPGKGEDAITLFGEIGKRFIIQDNIFDFRNVNKKDQDEIVSFVGGVDGIIRRCIFINGIKTLLLGNGDEEWDELDRMYGNWIMEDCIMLNCGRRNAEAQKTKGKMKRCWIHNFGHKDAFDVRTFSAWAHRGGELTLEDCVFTQDSFFISGLLNTIIDIGNHIGNAINERDLRLSNLLRPGVCRAVTASNGGKIKKAERCFTNKSWLYIENHKNPMEFYDARILIHDLVAKLPDIKSKLNIDLINIFDKATIKCK